MARPYFILLFPLIFLVFQSFLAHASGDLLFNNAISPSSKQLITSFLAEKLPNKSTNVKIAQVDLNEDGLPEFVTNLTPSCQDQNKICHYLILSENKGRINQLAEIEAYHIALGYMYTQNIRNILAFANSNNDYDYVVYIWDPKQARYKVRS